MLLHIIMFQPRHTKRTNQHRNKRRKRRNRKALLLITIHKYASLLKDALGFLSIAGASCATPYQCRFSKSPPWLCAWWNCITFALIMIPPPHRAHLRLTRGLSTRQRFTTGKRTQLQRLQSRVYEDQQLINMERIEHKHNYLKRII